MAGQGRQEARTWAENGRLNAVIGGMPLTGDNSGQPNAVKPAGSHAFQSLAADGSGTKTVLVAEDEPVVREFMAAVLREMGCIVLEAENGKQALGVFERCPRQRIDLLLTDIVMPVLGGKELACRAESLSPTTKTVFCSAYPEKLGFSNEMFDARVLFLQKPVTIDALKLKVREVLGDDTGSNQSHLPDAETGRTRQPARLSDCSSNDGDELKSTILVIDDDPLVLQIIKSLLVTRGYHVLTSSSAAKGLDMLRNAAVAIHIVVLGYSMPKLDGNETLKFIKQISPEAKIIGLTDTRLDWIPKAYLDGIDKLLKKPVVVTELIGVVDGFLGGGQSASSAIES
jgi:CheY-like chemotaxis protein